MRAPRAKSRVHCGAPRAHSLAVQQQPPACHLVIPQQATSMPHAPAAYSSPPNMSSSASAAGAATAPCPSAAPGAASPAAATPSATASAPLPATDMLASTASPTVASAGAANASLPPGAAGRRRAPARPPTPPAGRTPAVRLRTTSTPNTRCAARSSCSRLAPYTSRLPADSSRSASAVSESNWRLRALVGFRVSVDSMPQACVACGKRQGSGRPTQGAPGLECRLGQLLRRPPPRRRVRGRLRRRLARCGRRRRVRHPARRSARCACRPAGLPARTRYALLGLTARGPRVDVHGLWSRRGFCASARRAGRRGRRVRHPSTLPPQPLPVAAAQHAAGGRRSRRHTGRCRGRALLLRRHLCHSGRRSTLRRSTLRRSCCPLATSCCARAAARGWRRPRMEEAAQAPQPLQRSLACARGQRTSRCGSGWLAPHPPPSSAPGYVHNSSASGPLDQDATLGAHAHSLGPTPICPARPARVVPPTAPHLAAGGLPAASGTALAPPPPWRGPGPGARARAAMTSARAAARTHAVRATAPPCPALPACLPTPHTNVLVRS